MKLPTMTEEECPLCPEGVVEPQYPNHRYASLGDVANCDECGASYKVEWDGEQVGEDLDYKMSWVATAIISKGENK